MHRNRLLGAALAVAWVCVGVRPAVAHELVREQPLVIDTDLGLDDAVALAGALQSPDLRVAAVVAGDGACAGRTCAALLHRMLDRFNRSDVLLYGPAGRGTPKTAPPMRPFVERAVAAALPRAGAGAPLPFAPEAFAPGGRQTIVLALGPLTNLAAALKARPVIKYSITKVIIAGCADTSRNWNIRYDRAAYEAVRRSGVRLVFVAPREDISASWRPCGAGPGPGVSVGQGFVRRLLGADDVREHYYGRLGAPHDELGVLFLVEPTLFASGRHSNAYAPKDSRAVATRYARLLSEGRQRKPRVVFADAPLPASALRPDVRERMDRIIDRHGRTEWFAQLMMNELHEHLGAYSVIGVKMGLRAAELLNAPTHGMKVVSHVKPGPPVSCLNDGVIVATGCTPGRALFSYGPPDAGAVKVAFSYNGRTITLTLKDRYRGQVRRKIQDLLRVSSLDDHAYWDGVRRVGLDIWEHWHRCDLFDVSQPK
jgi:inosine-uridine preferring nucleoside hydrolase/FmdE protein associated with molybdenum formylmethanofuran dehydrogenase